MQNRALTAALIGASLLAPAPLFAQGKGLNRGLGAATKGASSAGLARSRSQLSRASGGAMRGAPNFSNAGRGWQRANTAFSQGQGVPQEDARDGEAGENQQRILDHRLNQAENLRTLSERNGNEHLLDSADRMKGKAHAQL